MRVDGINYELNWQEFTIGSSFFIACVGVTAAKERIERKMARLGFAVIVKVVVEDDIRGLRVWRKKK
jgi:hypothetical protein